jgi:hypothetical protein
MLTLSSPPHAALLRCALVLALAGCSVDMDDGKVWSSDGGGGVNNEEPGDGGTGEGDDGGGDGGDDSGDGDGGDGGDGEELVDIERVEGCNPFNVAGDCLTPFPSMWSFSPDDTSAEGALRLDLAAEDFLSPDGPLPVDPAMFNGVDGVSPTMPVIVNFGVDVDPAALWGHGEAEQSMAEGAPIALVQLSTGERVPLLTEMDQSNRDLGYEARHALIVRPMVPLEPGEEYGLAITTALTDVDGAPLPVPEAFWALRDGVLTTDEEVEGMREEHEALFAALDSAGYPRDGLALAFSYPVASDNDLYTPILSMIDQASADIATGGVPYTIDSVQVDPDEHTGWIIEGSFQPPSFLSADNELVLVDHVAQLQTIERPSYPFTVVIPAVAKTQSELPLLIFGHGLFGTGRGTLTSGGGGERIRRLANEFGQVVVATDWIGLSGGDLDLIITEVVPDISRISVVTDRLAQSLINTQALIPLMQDQLVEDESLGGWAEPLLSDAVYYYGGSLGGIQGSSFVSITPEVSRAVVSVPGAGWCHMIQRSTNFSPIEAVIDALYPDPLSQLVFIHLMQTSFDRSDPAVLTGLLNNTDEFPDREPPVILLQEAIGDVQVPNLTTDILVAGMGARMLETATDPIYGIDTVTGPATGVALTQYRLPENLAEYFPPDENVIPDGNNGVHGEAPTSEPALEQVEILVSTGFMEHVCDGPCDPD